MPEEQAQHDGLREAMRRVDAGIADQLGAKGGRIGSSVNTDIDRRANILDSRPVVTEIYLKETQERLNSMAERRDILYAESERIQTLIMDTNAIIDCLRSALNAGAPATPMVDRPALARSEYNKY